MAHSVPPNSDLWLRCNSDPLAFHFYCLEADGTEATSWNKLNLFLDP